MTTYDSQILSTQKRSNLGPVRHEPIDVDDDPIKLLTSTSHQELCFYFLFRVFQPFFLKLILLIIQENRLVAKIKDFHMSGGDDPCPELVGLVFEEVGDVGEWGEAPVVDPESVGAGLEDLEWDAVIKRVAGVELHAEVHVALDGYGDVLVLPHPVPLPVLVRDDDLVGPVNPHPVPFFLEVVSFGDEIMRQGCRHRG